MEELTIIQIEREIDELRNLIPDNKDLDEARRLICQAQNIMQKHIQKAFVPAEWKHTRTVAPSHSTYNLAPSE